ncbi:Hypothetical predicted protein [Paramuricea clavata]|uniref:Uncharacterized protein n=1 Tax=Paramuricea clavata TaxID=317549 RepID=A0A6S7IS94_PARCT|nr:Hypothetical predicted protein [Paramuricea clavata]
MAAAPENMDFDTSRQPSTSSSATNKKRFEVKKHFSQFSDSVIQPLTDTDNFELRRKRMSVKERKKETKHISEEWEKWQGVFGVLKRSYAKDMPTSHSDPFFRLSPRQGV